jgi:hypothetical protein
MINNCNIALLEGKKFSYRTVDGTEILCFKIDQLSNGQLAISLLDEDGQPYCRLTFAVNINLRKELIELEIKLDVDESINRTLNNPVASPCGHSSRYAHTEDGGKNIRCYLCELFEAESELKKWADSRDGILIENQALELRAMEAEKQLAKAEARLGKVVSVGHNNDCMFCGFKDVIAAGAIKEANGGSDD